MGYINFISRNRKVQISFDNKSERDQVLSRLTSNISDLHISAVRKPGHIRVAAAWWLSKA